MANDGTWVDHMFVQVLAWYMELDILTTSSQPENPFIVINGNLNNVPQIASGPSLLLGNYTNVHYQSLLPNLVGTDIVNEQQTNQNIVSKEEQKKRNLYTLRRIH
jgi:hypothetical protein